MAKSKAMQLAEKSLVVTKKLTKEEKLVEAKRRKALRNEITHKLRFDVMNRDNHVCQYCGCRIGQEMANGADCELVVDHIIPLDKGGNNDMDNLITACWVCNEGKKNTQLSNKGFKREYILDKEKIIRVAETSSFEEFRTYFISDEQSNKESYEYLYDLYEQKDERRCTKECKVCVMSGKFYYKSCMQKLYHKAKFNLDDRVGLPRELATIGEDINQSKANSLYCDFCYLSRRCPKYQLGASCGFTFIPVGVKSEIDFFNFIIKIQSERCAVGSFFEKVDGGALDKNLSSELALFASLLKAKRDSEKPKARITIEAEGEGKEGIDVVDKLLMEVFGGGKKEEVKNPAEDADYKNVVNEEKRE